MKRYEAGPATRAKMRIAALARCTEEWRRAKSELYETKLPTAKIAEMYASGMTQAEIASGLGVTQKVVWRHMRNHGLLARVAAKRNQSGSANSAWVGDAISYNGIHRRVEAERGKPMKCEVCGTSDQRRSYDWANVTGDYTTTISFVRMCRSCHWKFDNKIVNIRRMRKKPEGTGESA